jgi:DNA-binding MarR family transcriptional regulator
MARKKEEGLLELVEAYAAFQREHPQGDLDAFCRHRLAVRAPRAAVEGMEGFPLEGQMGRSFGRLARMVTVYSKKVLQPLGIQNLEDFGYLATLMDMGQPRKGELIRAMHSETTSGTSVIKRLVERGLMQELSDPEDGRSLRVRITAKGMRTLEKCFPAMIQVGHMVFGVLDATERKELFHLLRKMEEPHAKLLLERRNDSFEELMEGLYGRRGA